MKNFAVFFFFFCTLASLAVMAHGSWPGGRWGIRPSRGWPRPPTTTITRTWPTRTSPTRTWPTRPKEFCECINPFEGTGNAYRGDSDNLCGRGGPGMCYVSCNADCRDLEPTASSSRCQSRLACDQQSDNPSVLAENCVTDPGTGLTSCF